MHTLKSNFAPYGIASMICSIGLQDNHKVQSLDIKATGCPDCPYREECFSSIAPHCAACEKKVYKKSPYINEKNRYGDLPSLSHCAIKLMWYLHFVCNSKGWITELQASSSAKLLKMSDRNIPSCLEMLEQRGYIHYKKLPEGYYLIMICDYDRYFLPAEKGGRGYLTVSWEYFEQCIINTSSINQVRLNIRTLISIEEQRLLQMVLDDETFTGSKSISEMTYCFPKYVRPYHLRNIATKNYSGLTYAVSEFEEKEYISFTISGHLIGSLVKKQLTSEYSSSFEELFTKLNDSLKHYTIEGEPLSLVSIPEYILKQAVKARLGKYPFQIQYAPQDIDDISDMSALYGYDTVFSAIQNAFRRMLKPGDFNFAGKLGSIIRNTINSQLLASV